MPEDRDTREYRPVEREPERVSPEKGGTREEEPMREGVQEAPVERAEPLPQAHYAPSTHVSEEIIQESKEIGKLPQDRQVQALVDLAFHKGLRHAIDTARTMKNPYILDTFHDMLTTYLYRELVEKGKLKEL